MIAEALFGYLLQDFISARTVESAPGTGPAGPGRGEAPLPFPPRPSPGQLNTKDHEQFSFPTSAESLPETKQNELSLTITILHQFS